MPRRILEEPHGQRNPSDEKRINAEAEQKRKDEEARKRLQDFCDMMSSIPF